jgi:cysteinyl-tRNA synthetase
MTSLTLYNTLTKRKEPVRAADPANITFYTCGPTVYDDAHIGNFRSFLAADLLRRWLESPLCTIQDLDGNTHAGPRTVRHIMNITDVGHMTDDDVADGGGDDKMQLAAKRLLEAKKAGTAHVDIADPNDPRQIADFYTQRFLEDARKLGLKVAIEAEADPAVMPRATDNVEGMKRMIEDLASKGFAYRVGDAVYFDVQKYQQYGQLSGNTLDKLKGGAGGRVQDEHQAGKHHPADFLLWKSDPTHLMKWPGPTIDNEPMPEGYPGWHIECSVMSRVLCDTIDIHSGGEDNIFPHHECERAQSCCAHGTPEFARHWFHPRFLLVEGEKMSKSKGNFFTARELFEKHDPAAVRLELIKTHYRANANFTEQGLKDSARIIERWRRFIEIATNDGDAHDSDVATRFADAMADDLNIAAAIGAINSWVSSIDQPTSADAAQLRALDGVLGVLALKKPPAAETDIGLFTGGLEPDPAVIDKLIARRDAKKAKDFATSDRIRDELAAMGYAIKDVAGGKVEVSRA